MISFTRPVNRLRYQSTLTHSSIGLSQPVLRLLMSIAKIDIRHETSSVTDDWKNWVLANVNDHVVRISVMTRDFHWHRHSNSDEVLMPLEGSLIVDFEDQSMTIEVGQFVRVPQNVLHRTRPAEKRVVTLSFEHQDTSVTGE